MLLHRASTLLNCSLQGLLIKPCSTCYSSDKAHDLGAHVLATRGTCAAPHRASRLTCSSISLARHLRRCAPIERRWEEDKLVNPSLPSTLPCVRARTSSIVLAPQEGPEPSPWPQACGTPQPTGAAVPTPPVGFHSAQASTKLLSEGVGGFWEGHACACVFRMEGGCPTQPSRALFCSTLARRCLHQAVSALQARRSRGPSFVVVVAGVRIPPLYAFTVVRVSGAPSRSSGHRFPEMNHRATFGATDCLAPGWAF